MNVSIETQSHVIVCHLSDPVVVDGCLYGQNFDEIKAACLEAGELWTDPEFPPDEGWVSLREKLATPTLTTS